MKSELEIGQTEPSVERVDLVAVASRALRYSSLPEIKGVAFRQSKLPPGSYEDEVKVFLAQYPELKGSGNEI